MKLKEEFDSLGDLRQYFAEIRAHGDIYPINGTTSVVTDYELMRLIFRQPDQFRTFDFGDRIRKLQEIDAVKYDFEDIRVSMSEWLLFMDGPDHLAWKKRLMQRMYHIDLDHIIKTEWQYIVSSLEDRNEFDLMKEMIEPLICRILCSIMGFNPTDFSNIRMMEQAFMKALVPSMSLDNLREIKNAHYQFQSIQIRSWETGTLEQAKLLHALMCETEESQRANVMAQMEFMLAAGIESSIMLLTESIFRLLTDLRSKSDMLKHKDSRTLLVEELIRLSSAISVVSRKAITDIEIGGQSMKEGHIILMFIASANRDPRYFPYPEEVHPENQKNQHLAFGLGRHHCMGTELSRMEMNYILPAFMEQFGATFTIHPEDKETIKKSYYLPGIEQIRISRI
jgi:cytochrome P450